MNTFKIGALQKRSKSQWFQKLLFFNIIIAWTSLPSPALAWTYKYSIIITSRPAGATVKTNGVVAGTTPLTLEKCPFVDEIPLAITVSAAGYETQAISETRFQAEENAKRNLALNVDLVLVEQRVDVQFEADEGANFFVDGKPVSAQTTLLFKRPDSKSPWDSIFLRATRNDYMPWEKTLTLSETANLSTEGNRRKILATLVEVRRRMKLTVEVNEDDTQIFLNGKSAGIAGKEAPVTLELENSRSGKDMPWSVNEVRIAKEGFEYCPPAPAESQPEFVTNLTWEAAKSLGDRLDATHFQPLRQLPVPWRRFVVDRGEVRLEVTNVLSAIKPAGDVIQFNLKLGDDELFIADRFGVIATPDEKGKPSAAVIAVAKRVTRDGAPAEIVGSEIAMINPPPARILKRLTTIGEQQGVYDFQPCITRDGEWVYFSSNRGDGGQYRIFRIPAKSGRALAEISPPQPGIDVEPAVYTANDGQTRLAFTRYPAKSTIHAEPKIMVQGHDGTFSQVGESGHSPAWSNDGSKLLYVSNQGKICIMDPDTGEEKARLDYIGVAPAWLPGDKQIIFAKPVAKSYQLSIINWDGSGDPVNPIPDSSFYSFPCVSYDGKNGYIYFLSNRGAIQRGAESWGLYYMLQ